MLFQSCWQLVTSSANASCWRLVGRPVTTCAFLRVYTRKNLTACQQDVFAQLLPSFWQVWTKSLSSCIRMCSRCLFPVVVTRLMTVTELLQVVPSRLIQTVRNKLLHKLVVNLSCYQTCWNNLLRVCWPHQPWILIWLDNNLVTTFCRSVTTCVIVYLCGVW
jgi:hypothetical protein